MTVWLEVAGRRYPFVGFDAVTLAEVEAMEEQTGLTVDDVEDEWLSSDDLLATDRGRLAWAVRVWLGRMAVGEKPATVREATRGVPRADMRMVSDSAPAPEPRPVRRSRLLDGLTVREHVRRRIVTVAHVWPGITPMSVMGMRVDDWLLFAAAADEWVAARRKGADGG